MYHPLVVNAYTEMEMRDGRPTHRSILVIEADVIVDSAHPGFRQDVINEIVGSVLEKWTEFNPPEDNIRLVARSKTSAHR